jgi:hypothetical protein
LCSAIAIILSPPTLWTRSRHLATRPPVGALRFRLSCRLRLRHSLAGSPIHLAVSSLSSYGLIAPLPVLPTPPHGDAVPVGYRRERGRRGKTYTLLSEHLLRRTSAGLYPAARRSADRLATRETASSRGNARPGLRAGRRMQSGPTEIPPPTRGRLRMGGNHG